MKINEEYIILPAPQVTQKFAEGAVSVPQFKQNLITLKVGFLNQKHGNLF